MDCPRKEGRHDGGLEFTMKLSGVIPPSPPPASNLPGVREICAEC